MYLIYLPLAAAFAVFVVYGGVVMPAMEIAESIRNRRRTRPPDNVVELRPSGEPSPSGERGEAA
ncbi:hypothetical protein AB0C21_11230 [Spirillospora sp. NPDC049024]|uniref:hypothetical protein n=1 Tax=unclassified Actinomadura TaxID=2626254 RepID=UPI0011EE88E3|nr:hypothetical protein [Actinomadura sp. K4S16]